MDFYVYDNMGTLNKIRPEDPDLPDKRIPVKKIMIPPNGAFWFETDLDRKKSTVDVGRPYVHMHRNMEFDESKFNGNPHVVTDKIRYNPDNKCVEARTMKNIVGKTIWKKKIIGHYFGVELPRHPTFANPGQIFYNFYENHMYLVLDYYPMHNHAKRIDWPIIHANEDPTPEQYQYVEILEFRIKKLENELSG